MAKVVLCGLGAIGTEIARRLAEHSHEIVGVVDVDPEKAGKTVAELTGLPIGTRVSASLAELRGVGAEVAVFATRSRLPELIADIELAVSLGLHVITTSEEMAYPWSADSGPADRVDAVAKQKGVTVAGVGVNPGFVMDWVPAVIASAAVDPTGIHVVRSVDVTRRRRQLQAKVGVGLSKERFERGVKQGTLGHVGLAQSVHLIARSLGSRIEGLKEGVFPILGSDGYVMGVRQFAEGEAGKCNVRLDLEMSLTSADFDVVEVKGDPPLKLRFERGVFGDSATVALVVHAVERVRGAPRGLITVLDLPLTPA